MHILLRGESPNPKSDREIGLVIAKFQEAGEVQRPWDFRNTGGSGGDREPRLHLTQYGLTYETPTRKLALPGWRHPDLRPLNVAGKTLTAPPTTLSGEIRDRPERVADGARRVLQRVAHDR